MKQGWEIKKLGEVCDIQGGSTPKRTESLYWEGGTYPWFTIEDIREQGRIITDTKQKVTKVAWDKLRVFPKDTVLLCCTASIGEYAITHIPLTSNQQFNGLMIKDKSYLSPMYLMHYCATLKEKLSSLSGKATIDFVSAEKVRQITIPVPPREEQEKIVAELDCLRGVIEKKREQLRELDALAQSIFYTMFGDPITNEKGWEVKKLKEVARIIGGYAFKSDGFSNEGIPVLKIGNINTGKLKVSPIVYYGEDERLLRYMVYPNDLVISLTGTAGKDDYGNVCILDNTYPRYYLNQRNAKIDLSEHILTGYMQYMLKNPQIKSQLTGISRGVRQGNISNKDLEELDIQLPPLRLQQEFADKIEAIEKQKELIKKSISETETLFNACMDYYFN